MERLLIDTACFHDIPSGLLVTELHDDADLAGQLVGTEANLERVASLISIMPGTTFLGLLAQDAGRMVEEDDVPGDSENGVMIGPVIPGLTDHEIPAILEAASKAGAKFAGHIVLRLPGAVEQLFPAWLARHFPDRRDKVLHRLRSIRNGPLNDSRFVSRMAGEGVFADQIHDLFDIARKRVGLESDREELSSASFRRPTDGQMSLF